MLETQKNLSDIIFIQEPPRSLLHQLPSYTDPLGDPLYGTSNHPEWTLFLHQNTSQDNYARVAIYVNKWLLRIRFALCLDIINHHDINILAFHSDYNINFIINIYSDSNQMALYFLCQNNINLDNIIIMMGDFNIRNSGWDPNVHHHSIYTDDLITIADSLGLKLLLSLNPGPTRFADNP